MSGAVDVQVSAAAAVDPGRAEMANGGGCGPGTVPFDEIIRAYSPAVRRLARLITGHGGAADDVTQEVFLRYWLRQATFDPSRGPLWAWLNMLTRAAAVDWVRQEAGCRARELRLAERAHGNVIDADQFEHVEDCLVVRQILGGLRAGERAAIEVAYLQERTFREVAEVLGLAEGTAKSRIRIGMARLRTDHEFVA